MQFAIFINGLPLDLTPSIKPGCGNCIFHPVADFNSKNCFALGFLATYSVKLPLNCFNFKLSMAMMLSHTRSSKPVSCETMIHVTFFNDKR